MRSSKCLEVPKLRVQQMSIRLKIVLIVVPLIVATLALTGVSSYFSASNGITRVAKDFLGFKAQELQGQAESQWRLLVDNNLTARAEMVAATKAAVEGYAGSIIRSPTELILAVDAEGAVVMSTGGDRSAGDGGAVSFQGDEQQQMAALARGKSGDLLTVWVGGKARVGKGFWFEPFGWYMVVSEERSAFYDQVNQIAVRTGILLVGSIVAGVVLVLVFARYLTRPLTRVVDTMKEIISTNDLSERVVVEYHDEIGQLAQTFNLMVQNLSEAYRQIKGFAFKAVIAQRQEKRTQTLFGKFVPEHVIHQFFANPEDTLVGDNRVLAVLFSDIRSFTTISERMKPDELVHSLNRYFDTMVAIIMKRQGIIDKYIGDAIKAFFGAQADPAAKQDFALQSVLAGIEMIEALGAFNEGQKAAGMPEFAIGVGVNYGLVTIGNIGTEKRKEYTVIGEMVDLAEHFEGLTKTYHQPVIFSESLHRSVKDELPCRLLDSVPSHESSATKIYTARRTLGAQEKEAWGLHNMGMAEYYERNFEKAAGYFRDVLRVLPGDDVATMQLERSARYARDPPPSDWNGIELSRAS
jgi:class 3 adenylate cyclase/HAMP domain-containing protein